MKPTFKESFDKYELLLTPLFLILIFILIITFMPQIVPLENFDQIFLFPLIIGFIFGILVSYLLDTFWKKVSFSNISDFLKIPTIVLIILSSLATLIVTYDVFMTLAIIGFGLGSMVSIISLTSLVVYYRTYLNIKK